MTSRRRRVAVAHGFSLHADTAVHGHDRQGLERLASHGARGPIAASRLRRLDDGRYEDSPTKGLAFTVTAAQLVRRLVSLVPPGWTSRTGYVQTHVNALWTELASAHEGPRAYICGVKKMVSAAREVLRVDRKQVHLEAHD